MWACLELLLPILPVLSAVASVMAHHVICTGAYTCVQQRACTQYPCCMLHVPCGYVLMKSMRWKDIFTLRHLCLHAMSPPIRLHSLCCSCVGVYSVHKQVPCFCLVLTLCDSQWHTSHSHNTYCRLEEASYIQPPESLRVPAHTTVECHTCTVYK